jgi:hypothetical protein
VRKHCKSGKVIVTEKTKMFTYEVAELVKTIFLKINRKALASALK